MISASTSLGKPQDSKDEVTKDIIRQFKKDLIKSYNYHDVVIDYLNALVKYEFDVAKTIKETQGINTNIDKEKLIYELAELLHPDNPENHNRLLMYLIKGFVIPPKELEKSTEEQREAAYHAARALFYLKVNFWPSSSCDVLKEKGNRHDVLDKIFNNIKEAFDLYTYMWFHIAPYLNQNVKIDGTCYETYVARQTAVLKLLNYLTVPGSAEKKAETEDSPFALYALFRKNVLLIEQHPLEDKYHCAAIAAATRFLFVNRRKADRKTYVQLLSREVDLFLNNYIEKNLFVKYLPFALKANDKAAYEEAYKIPNTHETTTAENDRNIANFVLNDRKDPLGSRLRLNYFRQGMQQACGRKIPPLEKFIKGTPTSSDASSAMLTTKSERSISPGDDKKSVVEEDTTPKPANDRPRPKPTPYPSYAMFPPIGKSNAVAASVVKEIPKKGISRDQGGKSVELSSLYKKT